METKNDSKTTRAAIRAQTQHLLDALSGLGAAPRLTGDLADQWEAGWHAARLVERLTKLRDAANFVIWATEAADKAADDDAKEGVV